MGFLSGSPTLIENGWWALAHKVPSPNFNSRPKEAEISLLVIHNISLPPGEFGGGHINNFFCNQLEPSLHPYFETIHTLKVSSHLLIDRTGYVSQFVSFDDRAWHSGRSSFQGVEECNDYSIGIELEGADDMDYTDAQYEKLKEVTAVIMRKHPKITTHRITGHSDVAPGRKTDPGPHFDWVRYLSSLSR